jgi:hypothetical protein
VLLGLRQSSFELVLSSFLVAEGLLKHAGAFMRPRYKEVRRAVPGPEQCD